MDIILEQAGIPLLLFVICVYYGIRLLVLKDIAAIRPKDKPPVREEEGYVKAAGILILVYGAATLVMAVLIFVNVYAAFVQIAVCTVLMGAARKRIADRYGA